MLIHELHLSTHALATQKVFYRDVLRLPIEIDAADHFTVIAGTTRLTFTTSDGWVLPIYHFAFNVPRNQFAAARVWIETRTPLIPHSDGAVTWHSGSWNADIVYFYDPAGNIVEFIARQTLPDESSAPFSPADVRCISEIGLAVDDVRATAEALSSKLRLPVYDGIGSDSFTALGDEHGLLIIVRKGRPWFPTQDRLAAEGSTRVVIASDAPAVTFADGRYVIETRPAYAQPN